MTTSRMIETSVGRLHVEIDGDGPPAVLWHSLFVDSGSWSRMRPLLRDERRMIVVDGPGHGQSSTPPPTFTLDDCAQAAVEVMDAVGASEPVDWVGNAWGGHVGLTLAAKVPERLRSVATIATPVHALTRRERLTIVPMVGVYRFIGAVPPLANGVVRALLGPAIHAVATGGHRRGGRGVPQRSPTRHAPCDDVGHAPPRRPGSAAADDRDTDADGGADRRRDVAGRTDSRGGPPNALCSSGRS